MVVAALVVIPYFNINIEGRGIWANTGRKPCIIGAVLGFMVLIFALFGMGQLGHSGNAVSKVDHMLDLIVPILPTLLVGGVLLLSSRFTRASSNPLQGWLADRPISFWIMTWFLVELVVLTAVGTLFRGPGWTWIWPPRVY